MTEWHDGLRDHNNAFKALRAQRVEEKAALTKARVETDKHYKNIVMHIEYMVKDEKTSQSLTDFITELNALINSYKVVLAHTKHKKTDGGNQIPDDNNDE